MSTYMEFMFDRGYIDISTIVLTEMSNSEGMSIAKKLGVRFLGIWKELGDKFIFNDDDVTESSFTAGSFQEAEKKLKALRSKFSMA